MRAWKAKIVRLPLKEMHFRRQSQRLCFQEEAEGITEEIVPHVSLIGDLSHILLYYYHANPKVFIIAPNSLTNISSSFLPIIPYLAGDT